MDFRPVEPLMSPDNLAGIKALMPKNVELSIKEEINKNNFNTRTLSRFDGTEMIPQMKSKPHGGAFGMTIKRSVNSENDTTEPGATRESND